MTKSILKEAVEAGQINIVGARYDLDTGAVEIFS
jgi:carbonic anhydrase